MGIGVRVHCLVTASAVSDRSCVRRSIIGSATPIGRKVAVLRLSTCQISPVSSAGWISLHSRQFSDTASPGSLLVFYQLLVCPPLDRDVFPVAARRAPPDRLAHH